MQGEHTCFTDHSSGGVRGGLYEHTSQCQRLIIQFGAHREGTLISLVTPAEEFVVDKLCKQLGITARKAEVSGGEMRLLDRKPSGVPVADAVADTAADPVADSAVV